MTEKQVRVKKVKRKSTRKDAEEGLELETPSGKKKLPY